MGDEFRMVVTYDKIGEIVKKFPDLASAVVKKTASDIVADAQHEAPVRTGNLKNSIKMKMETDHRAVINVGAEYGAFVEFGTRKMPAHPFLRPAVNDNKKKFLEAMRKIGKFL